MRLMLILGLLTVALGACSSSRPSASVLQRYDELATRLDRVTLGSRQVARDVSALRRPMRWQHAARVRQLAIRMKRDSMRLSRAAGDAGNRVRRLVARASSEQRSYLSLVVRVLESQWQEGRSVAGMAAVLTADPLLMSPSDVTSLQHLQRAARGYAASAGRASRAAGALRAQHPDAFRYSPISVAAMP